jgi:hypothetical protein
MLGERRPSAQLPVMVELKGKVLHVRCFSELLQVLLGPYMMYVHFVDQHCKPPQHTFGKPSTVVIPSLATLLNLHTSMDPFPTSFK